jgi:hypothetical protein
MSVLGRGDRTHGYHDCNSPRLALLLVKEWSAVEVRVTITGILGFRERKTERGTSNESYIFPYASEEL